MCLSETGQKVSVSTPQEALNACQLREGLATCELLVPTSQQIQEAALVSGFLFEGGVDRGIEQDVQN